MTSLELSYKMKKNILKKIIFNDGNDITFVNKYEEIIEKVPFDMAT